MHALLRCALLYNLQAQADALELIADWTQAEMDYLRDEVRWICGVGPDQRCWLQLVQHGPAIRVG